MDNHVFNLLSNYRLRLDPSIRNQKALLIMDGHHSRENPVAIMLLEANNINLLILPSHVTHILQMFDVCLASPMKSKFTTLFQKKVIENLTNNTFQTNIANIRHASIYAAITAWISVCTLDNCVSAAKKTGTYPCDVNVVKSSPYVRTLEGDVLNLYNKKKQYL